MSGKPQPADNPAYFTFVDEQGAPLYRERRTATAEGKAYIQERQTPWGWKTSLEGAATVPFHLDRIATRPGQTVVLVEGAWNATYAQEIADEAGLPVTFTALTNGANGWKLEYATTLARLNVSRVIVLADWDEQGIAFAQKAAGGLYAVGMEVKVVNLADSELDTESVLTEKADIVDWLWLYTEQFHHTPEELLTRLLDYADDIEAWRDTEDETKEIDEMLNDETKREHNWLVPDVFEVGDRLTVTGDEGAGKSTLLRQMSVTIAAGINPYDPLKTYEPVPVLIVDLENSKSQVRREIAPLRDIVGDRLKPGHLFIEVRPEGIDLTDEEDEAWLERKVARYLRNGGVLVIGPVYKLTPKDQKDDVVVLEIQQVLDHLRTTFGLAIVQEAHTRHPEHSGSGRTVHRPFGSRQQMRWVEFGFHLDESGVWTPWRQPRDASRQFPTRFVCGDRSRGEMPWVGQVTDADRRYQGMVRVARDRWQVGDPIPKVKKMVTWMREDAKQNLIRAGMSSTRALVAEACQNYTQSKVQALIGGKGSRAEDWQAMFDAITEGARVAAIEADITDESGEAA